MNNENEKILDLYKVQPKVLVSYKLTVAKDELPVAEKKVNKIQKVFMNDDFFNQVTLNDDFYGLRDAKYKFILNPNANIKEIVLNHFADDYSLKKNGYSSTKFDIYDIKKYKDLSLVLVQLRKSKLDNEISKNTKKRTRYFLLAIKEGKVILQNISEYFSGLFIHKFISSKKSSIHMIFQKDENIITNFKAKIEGV